MIFPSLYKENGEDKDWGIVKVVVFITFDGMSVQIQPDLAEESASKNLQPPL
jgi:hypothetical protein